MSAHETTPAPAALEVQAATVVRGGSVVLREVSARIGTGEVVAILGPNGSGKSTLLRAMIGILPLASGMALIEGHPVRERTPHDALGYVPQMAAFSGNIAATAREVVQSGNLTAHALFRRASKKQMLAALDAVGMADLASRPITHMSGGQRQRVMIARALVRSPRILVLDEPFTGVDHETQERIAELIRTLNETGCTVAVVLHDLAPLEHIITKALVLTEGSIVHDGPLPHTDPHDWAAHSHGGEHHVEHVIDQCLGTELAP